MSLEEDGRLLAQPLTMSQSKARRSQLEKRRTWKLGLGDNGKSSKIVPEKVDLLDDKDIVHFVLKLY